MLEWLKKKFSNEAPEEKDSSKKTEREIEKEGEERSSSIKDSLENKESSLEDRKDIYRQEEIGEETLSEEEDLLEKSDGILPQPEEESQEENTDTLYEDSPQEISHINKMDIEQEYEGDNVEEISEEIERGKSLEESKSPDNLQDDFLTIEEENSLEDKKEEINDEAVGEEKSSFFQRLKNGLTKTRNEMGNKINEIIGSYIKIDEDMIEDIEDMLISADIGMETTMTLIDALKMRIKNDKVKDPKMVKSLLSEEIQKLLEDKTAETSLNITSQPAVILVVGVNGVGKTTTIGKLTQRLKNEGKSVLIAAGDTFRAAAIEQLKSWGDRSHTEVIAHQEGADPAAVIFDAIQAAKSRKIDVLICDTAGRLHNKKNLMHELEKIHKIIAKNYPQASKEVLLVLDATTGQNALIQAKTFNEVTNLTGIALTKLDGTAKGGVVLPLVTQLSIPIKLIGVGEGINDLQKFSPKEFAKALLSID